MSGQVEKRCVSTICALCQSQLTICLPTGEGLQPIAGGSVEVVFLDGGYVELVFCYGSTKFDRHVGVTRFKGYICDGCAEKMVPNMTETTGGP